MFSIIGNVYLISQLSTLRSSQDSIWYDLQVNRISAKQQLSVRLNNVLNEPDNELEVSKLIGDFATVNALSGNMNVISQASPELRSALFSLYSQVNIVYQRYFANLQFRDISEEEFQELKQFQSNLDKATNRLDTIRIQAFESGDGERYIRDNAPDVINTIMPYIEANEELSIISDFR